MRAQVTQRRVATLTIVEDLDVVEQLAAGLETSVKASITGLQFSLEGGKEALGHRSQQLPLRLIEHTIW